MSVPSPVNESLLSQRLGALGSARSWAPNVLPELERFIRTADDYDLFRVNPIQYGSLVDLSEADAIELFVHAAKVGLFEMDWLLICAYCPQVAGSFRELDQVHPRFQCAFYNAINPFPEDARGNAERQAEEFGVEIGERRGGRVPRRVFQRLLPEQPTLSGASAPITSSEPRFERIASVSYASAS